jgi:hypothetical protein
MKALNFTLTAIFIMLLCSLFNAQSIIQKVDYDFENINVRNDTAFALARIGLDIPAKGKVIALMEGDCVSSLGDNITFGVSNSSTWLTNFGNMGILLFDSLHNKHRYFHTMTFNVVPGKMTFSAYAHNWTDRNGSGHISAQGNFIVEYIPENDDEIRHTFKNLSVYPFNINEDLNLVDSISITTDKPAKILFSFDGRFYSRSDTEVMFVINDAENMSNGAEIFNVHIPHISRMHSFSRQIVRHVEPGTHKYYVMCRKLKGNFTDTENAVYGTLRATVFYDEDNARESVLKDKFEATLIPNGSRHPSGEIEWSVPAKGKLVVGYAGVTELSSGQQMNISIQTMGTDINRWEDIQLQTLHPDDRQVFFSMQRVYDVLPGDLIIEAFARPEGSSVPVLFRGDLMIRYVADPVISASTEFAQTQTMFEIFPNPVSDHIRFQIQGTPDSGTLNLRLRDYNGRLVRQYSGVEIQSGILDVHNLENGVYFIEIQHDKFIQSRKFIKI